MAGAEAGWQHGICRCYSVWHGWCGIAGQGLRAAGAALDLSCALLPWSMGTVAHLTEKGVLNAEEYESRKAKLLAG